MFCTEPWCVRHAGFVHSEGNCTDPTKPCVADCNVLKTITGNKTGQGPHVASGLAGKLPPCPEPMRGSIWPSWPASSPWVTAVGATRFHLDKVGNPEAAVNSEDHFGSGGGFSLCGHGHARVCVVGTVWVVRTDHLLGGWQRVLWGLFLELRVVSVRTVLAVFRLLQRMWVSRGNLRIRIRIDVETHTAHISCLMCCFPDP